MAITSVPTTSLIYGHHFNDKAYGHHFSHFTIFILGAVAVCICTAHRLCCKCRRQRFNAAAAEQAWSGEAELARLLGEAILSLLQLAQGHQQRPAAVCRPERGPALSWGRDQGA